MTTDAPTRIMVAARECLLDSGYASLSTRKVADRAGLPVSQIHYHFGGKQGLVLALLARENELLVSRQRVMYGRQEPLWKRYEQACDFLDDDLASGYVRVLQEMIAASWSDPVVAHDVLAMLRGWFEVLTAVAREAEERFGSLGPFTADDVAALVGAAFLGGEALILLGDEDWSARLRTALRRFADLIREREDELSHGREDELIREREDELSRDTADRA